MHPVHDVDSLLILAIALSSKRRPAELLEIVAAADLLQNNIPNEAKLVEAFDRLAKYGLLKAEADGFALTAPAQEIITGLPRKAARCWLASRGNRTGRTTRRSTTRPARQG